MTTTIARERNALTATPGGPLRGRVAVSGDKSISHRALVLGAMAEGETRISGLLESHDVLATAAAVRALGTKVDRDGDGAWRVTGGRWRSPAEPIDCGNSGTSARLLIGAAAARPIHATFTGDDSLRRRPMDRVLKPLRQMGAQFDGTERLPITVHGGALGGIRFVNSTASAQVKSAVLLAGLKAEGPVEIVEPLPTRDHSERMLRAFGADVAVEPKGSGWAVRLGARRILRAADVTVPGDPSSAAFPLVAALLVPGSEVTVTGMLLNPLRNGLLDTLLEMGADLEIANRRELGGEQVGDVTARFSPLAAIEVPAERAPAMIDEYPILAVAAAFARGSSMMHGLAELRVKESDRLAAMVDGLGACGVRARGAGDTLEIEGGAPTAGADVATQGDHRIAMSFLVLGLAARAPVRVDRQDIIATSFPGFAELMRGLGADIAG
jgi:3-phosphoshikimate 1-carboxyvinyltransferase